MAPSRTCRVFSLSAEAKFAQNLACNDAVLRDRATRKLYKWMTAKSRTKNGFTADDFVKIWKGLHYCMWMSDKPLIQEELASSVGSLIHCFNPAPSLGVLFYGMHLRTLAREWGLLDKWRINKFMMLTRRCLHQAFAYLKNHMWDSTLVETFASHVYDEVLSPAITNLFAEGLKMHYADLYIDELNAVAGAQVVPAILQKILEPFSKVLLATQSDTLLLHVRDNIFLCILNESKHMPDNDGDNAENNSAANIADAANVGVSGDDSNDDSNTFKLKFNYEAFAEHLFELLSKQESRAKSRRVMYDIISRYRAYSLGVCQPAQRSTRKVKRQKELTEQHYDAALERLDKLEQHLKNMEMPTRKRKREDMEKTYVKVKEEGRSTENPAIMERVLTTATRKKGTSDAADKIEKKFRGNKFKMAENHSIKNIKVGNKSSDIVGRAKRQKLRKEVANDENITINSPGDGHLETLDVERGKVKKRKMAASCLAKKVCQDGHPLGKARPLKVLKMLSDCQNRSSGSRVEKRTSAGKLNVEDIAGVKIRNSEIRLMDVKVGDTGLDEGKLSHGKMIKGIRSGITAFDAAVKNGEKLNDRKMDKDGVSCKVNGTPVGKIYSLQEKDRNSDLSILNESNKSPLSAISSEINILARKSLNLQQKSLKKSPPTVDGVDECESLNERNSLLTRDADAESGTKKNTRAIGNAVSDNRNEIQTAFFSAEAGTDNKATVKSLPEQVRLATSKSPAALTQRARSMLTPSGHILSQKPMSSRASSTPKTATPMSGKKRVSFGMHRNISLDFEDSINFSPGLPFHPQNVPEQGILKSTPQRPPKGTPQFHKHNN